MRVLFFSLANKRKKRSICLHICRRAKYKFTKKKMKNYNNACNECLANRVHTFMEAYSSLWMQLHSIAFCVWLKFPFRKMLEILRWFEKSPPVISLLVQLKRHTNKCMKRNDLLCVIQHNFRHSLLSSMIFFSPSNDLCILYYYYYYYYYLVLAVHSNATRVKWWICINWRKPSKLIQWKKISYVIRFIKPQSFSGLFFFGARSAYSSRELFVYYHNCELKCVAGLLKSTLNWEFYPE